MSPFDDYSEDMGDPLALDDATAEALLRGRPVALGSRQDLAAVSAFIAEMRDFRSAPAPAPSPALALLLRDDAVVEDAQVAERPAAVSRERAPALPSPLVRRRAPALLSAWRNGSRSPASGSAPP